MAQPRIIFSDDYFSTVGDWVIGSTDPNETIRFPITNAGISPTNIIEHKGAFYGITTSGGDDFNGTLFRYNQSNNSIETLHHFFSPGFNDEPRNIVATPGGKLFGVLRDGEVFKYDLNTNEYDTVGFTSNTTVFSGLTLANNGKIYGTTYRGGSNDRGTIFEVDTAALTITTIHEFNSTNGAYPRSTLTQASDGNLYGTTGNGGSNDQGTIFKIDISNNTFNTVFEFNSSDNGAYPYTALTEGPDSLLYGVLEDDELFGFDTNTLQLTKLITLNNSTEGNFVFSLTTINNEILGLTADGGVNDEGSLFKFNPNDNTFEVYFNFSDTLRSNKSKILPLNDNEWLMPGSGENIFNGGNLYKFNKDTKQIKELVDFNQSLQGFRPVGPILYTSTNQFFGVTSQGGLYNKGTIYEYLPAHDSIIARVHFGDGEISFSQRSTPYFVEGPNQLMYGYIDREIDGTNSSQLISFNPKTYELDYLFDFATVAEGTPSFGLVFDGNDAYGTLSAGGLGNRGGLFKFNVSTKLYQLVYSFDDPNKTELTGGSPAKHVFKDGYLYGITNFGGTGGRGTVYKFNTANNQMTILKSLGNNDPNRARYGLVTHSNGKFYVETTEDFGGLLELDPTNDQVNTVVKFRSIGRRILSQGGVGYLSEGPNGLLWGVHYVNGQSGSRGIYTYDLTNNVFTDLSAPDRYLQANALNIVNACVKPTPANIPQDVTLCEGETLNMQLNAENADTYSWVKDNSSAERVGTTTISTQDQLILNNVARSDAGTYIVEMTNSCGTSNYTFTLTVLSPNEVNASLKNITCHGGNDGSITVEEPICNNGPFLYSINNNATQDNNVFNGLTAGNYTITITDDDGNRFSEEFELTEPSAINIIESDVTDASCSKSTDGQISLLVTGGTSHYQYSIDGENHQVSAIFENLGKGTYTVIVRDNLQCSTSINLTVNSPDELELSAQIVNTPCFGGNNGSITLSAQGGTAPYLFRLDGSSFDVKTEFTGLSTGEYTFTVQDANLCETSTVFSVSADTIGIDYQKQDISCFGEDDGKITVIPSGGIAPYTYSLDGANYGNIDTFTDLKADTYTLHVKDANDCTNSFEVTITEPDQLSFKAESKDESCADKKDGIIWFTPLGGTGPYEYSIDNSTFQSSNEFTNLESGEYNLTIKDANSCTYSEMFVLGEVAPLNIQGEVTASTAYPENGAISLNVSGGNIPYSYLWDNNDTTATITDLIPGQFEVTVTDLMGCTATEVFAVGGVTSTSEKLFEDAVTVYPNPTQETLYLDLPSKLIGSKIRVYDSNAKLLLTKKATNINERLDLKAFEAGLYTLRIDNGKVYRFTLH